MDKREKIKMPSSSNTLVQLLCTPGAFFQRCHGKCQVKHAALYLTISSVIFTAAALSLQRFANPLLNGAILFANAVGMVLILSGIGYAVMGASIGRKAPFTDFFCVYAYASGTTLLLAWVPSVVLFTEPWRWILIGIGLKRGCRLGTAAVLWIVCGSIAVVTLFFWTMLPLLKT